MPIPSVITSSTRGATGDRNVSDGVIYDYHCRLCNPQYSRVILNENCIGKLRIIFERDDSDFCRVNIDSMTCPCDKLYKEKTCLMDLFIIKEEK